MKPEDIVRLVEIIKEEAAPAWVLVAQQIHNEMLALLIGAIVATLALLIGLGLATIGNSREYNSDLGFGAWTLVVLSLPCSTICWVAWVLMACNPDYYILTRLLGK